MNIYAVIMRQPRVLQNAWLILDVKNMIVIPGFYTYHYKKRGMSSRLWRNQPASAMFTYVINDVINVHEYIMEI